MKKTITIIGVGGQMGQWFANYFSEIDFDVTGFDTENKIQGKGIITIRFTSWRNFKSRLCSTMYTYKENT